MHWWAAARSLPSLVVVALVSGVTVACDSTVGPSGDAATAVDRPPDAALPDADAPLDARVDAPPAPDVPAPDAPALDAPAPDASPPRRRSVLILIADDLGVDSTGLYADRDGDGAPDDGRTYAPMPVVSALCRRGVAFRHAWSAATCSPTRAQILTGRFPFRTGVLAPTSGATYAIRAAERTLPRALDLTPSLDVAHANIGKWHLGSTPALGGNNAPNRMGWSHYSGALAFGINSFFAWDRVTDGLLERIDTYATTVNVDDAGRWLDAQRPERPWLLWVAFNAPHSPFHLPPASLVSTSLPGTAADITARPLPYYRAAIEALDREIGRLLRHPRVVGDDPLVVFVGDNGTPGEVTAAPFDRTRSKWTPYENGIHVPLCAAGGGVAGARWSDALVNVVDLYATALDAAGAPRATWEAAGQPIDSVSLWPLLRDPASPPPRRENFAEATAGAGPGASAANLGRAARDDRYKLLRFNDGREELYDLTADPRELVNLRARVEADTALRARYTALVGVLDRHR